MATHCLMTASLRFQDSEMARQMNISIVGGPLLTQDIAPDVQTGHSLCILLNIKCPCRQTGPLRVFPLQSTFTVQPRRDGIIKSSIALQRSLKQRNIEAY